MGRVVALRHLAFEDLGSVEALAREHGHRIEYVDAPTAQLAEIDAASADLLVVLGGPIGAYDDALYPFLRDELRLIEQRLKLDRPTLGICLGAQLMARALGARVYPGPAKEIGWTPLTLTDAGRASCIAPFDGASTNMLHWHGDTFDLPAGATLLASTDLTRHQAYAWGANALAFQCHPEALGATFERWLVGHACELGAARVDINALREATRANAPALERAAAQCFAAWFEQTGLSRNA